MGGAAGNSVTELLLIGTIQNSVQPFVREVDLSCFECFSSASRKLFYTISVR